MKKQEVTIKGITYTVRSTTEEGLAKAVKDLKKAVKRMTEDKKKDEE